MERCTECKAKKGTESSHKHRDRMGKRPYSAPRNKLMTDHLSFLMITLRQKFGISLNVLQQSCHSHFYTCASLFAFYLSACAQVCVRFLPFFSLLFPIFFFFLLFSLFGVLVVAISFELFLVVCETVVWCHVL